MSGGRSRPFRLGDRSELLVEQLLAAFAFTTPVPRQEDVGVDFFCSLTHQEGQFLKAGPFFAVQAKSRQIPLFMRNLTNLNGLRIKRILCWYAWRIVRRFPWMSIQPGISSAEF